MDEHPQLRDNNLKIGGNKNGQKKKNFPKNSSEME